MDRDRLTLQATRERKSPEWAPLLKPENRCVFLGNDDACTIYEDRPAVCRKVLVTTPVVECSRAEGRPYPVLFRSLNLFSALL